MNGSYGSTVLTLPNSVQEQKIQECLLSMHTAKLTRRGSETGVTVFDKHLSIDTSCLVPKYVTAIRCTQRGLEKTTCKVCLASSSVTQVSAY